MTELITDAQANALLLAVLIIGLVAGPVAAVVARRRGGDALQAGLLAGGPPVLLFVLWCVYSAITERLGLDSVVNLLVNLALFVVVGGLCGVGWAFLAARRGAEPSAAERLSEESSESLRDP